MANILAGASIFRALFEDIWGCGDYYATNDGLPPEEKDNFMVKGHPWTSCGVFDEEGFIEVTWRLEGQVLLKEHLYLPSGSELFIRTSSREGAFIRDDIQVETDYDTDSRQLILDFQRP